MDQNFIASQQSQVVLQEILSFGQNIIVSQFVPYVRYKIHRLFT